MLLIETEDLNKWIGARQLLENISVNIYQGDKIGFIGRNGTGKSTLLKIINGQDKEFQGQININSSVGYLPQFYNYQSGQTVEEFFIEVSYDYGSFLRLMREFGFEKEFLDRYIADCSGGEQTKLQLIGLLIEEPDLLILDEPTNHLDIETRDWLAGFLQEYQGGILLVSHDRYFLDQVVNEIWELEDAKLKEYTGDYSDYRKQKEIELERKRKEYEKYQAEKKRLKDRIQKQQQFVNRADKAQEGSDRRRARFAGRVKGLNSQLEQLDEKEKPFEYKEINPGFDQKELHNQIIIQGKGISKRFQTETVFEDLDFNITRDSKVALIGKNGIGKSLLLKIILGEEEMTDGKLFISSSLEIGYFSQKLANLHDDLMIIEEVQKNNPEKSNELIRTFLGSMLFKGKDVYKKVGNLSVGEKVRVAFTILLLSDANFLLLDEPLNHLDIVSRERIEAALKEYPGSFLVVTHDRYFARKTANEIWELSEKGLECFQGNYSHFIKYKNGEFKAGQDLEDELIKMRKVELLARLEEASNEEEIEKITAELDKL